MKRVIAVLLILICCFGFAIGEPATPTDMESIEDYVEIDDDDFGSIDKELIERRVFLEWLTQPTYYDEEVTLVAILVDFLPTDKYTFVWEYSTDGNTWRIINCESKQTYTFVLNDTNKDQYWRVKVVLQED